MRGYGWLPDLPDHRDRRLALDQWAAKVPLLPPSVDLEGLMPPVYDQGKLGSCTGNGIAGNLHFLKLKEALSEQGVPSRLFIYYNERVIEGTVDSDSGAMIRDGIKSVAQIGCPPEIDWPYDIAKFAERPSDLAFADAKLEKAIQYSRVDQTTEALKTVLANGYPVVLGFSVYESFETLAVEQTGMVPMPQPHERLLGGHCVLLVGYDDATGLWKLRNSWGPAWGQRGYFFMPYAYLVDENLADDFWTIELI